MMEMTQAQRQEIYDNTTKLGSTIDRREEVKKLMENSSEFWKTETSGKPIKEMKTKPQYNLGEYTVIDSITESSSYPIGTYRPPNGYPDHVITKGIIEQSEHVEIEPEDQKVEINICTNCNFYQTQKTKIAVISLITVLLSITLIVLKKVLRESPRTPSSPRETEDADLTFIELIISFFVI